MQIAARLVKGTAVLALAAALGVPPAAASSVAVARDVQQAAELTAPAETLAAPPGFVAASTSWTSTQEGWLLGFAPCTTRLDKSCPALIHTTDGGGSWVRAKAPAVRVSPRFIQARISFAAKTPGSGPPMGLATDGKRLFVTFDEARTWHRADVGAGASLGDMGLTGRSAYVIVGTGSTTAGTTTLFTSKRGENSWHSVPKVHTAGNGVNIDGGYDLATRGNDGAVALGRIFVDTGYWTTKDGVTWAKRPAPCTSDQLPRMNWIGPHRAVATCSYDSGMSKQFKDVRQSVDGGAFTTTSSAPVDLFTNATSAATPNRPFIGATAAGVGWLYGTFDRGATWRTVLRVNDELPFYDLQFTDKAHGVVVSGGSAYGRGAVYTTTDGGATWQLLQLAR